MPRSSNIRHDLYFPYRPGYRNSRRRSITQVARQQGYANRRREIESRHDIKALRAISHGYNFTLRDAESVGVFSIQHHVRLWDVFVHQVLAGPERRSAII